MRRVLIVNGYPRAGKDTSIGFMKDILKGHGVAALEFSSIDPVREMTDKAGIDTSLKTPEDRALWAEIGAAVEKHSGFRSKECIARAIRFFARWDNAAVFLHIREPKVIETVAGGVRALADAELTTIFIESDRAERVTSNAADLGVEGMVYDYRLANNGSLDLLKANCRCLLHTLDLIPNGKAAPPLL